jgi:hypothetical protein
MESKSLYKVIIVIVVSALLHKTVSAQYYPEMQSANTLGTKYSEVGVNLFISRGIGIGLNFGTGLSDNIDLKLRFNKGPKDYYYDEQYRSRPFEMGNNILIGTKVSNNKKSLAAFIPFAFDFNSLNPNSYLSFQPRILATLNIVDENVQLTPIIGMNTYFYDTTKSYFVWSLNLGMAIDPEIAYFRIEIGTLYSTYSDDFWQPGVTYADNRGYFAFGVTFNIQKKERD